MTHTRTVRWIALSMLLGALAPVAAHAAGATAFVDSNNNGVFDAGDVKLTPAMVASGSFSTTESIVVPLGVRLGGDPAVGLSLHAGKNLTVLGSVAVPGGDVDLTADGSVTVATSARVMAGSVHVSAGGDIAFARGASLDAGDYVMIEAGGSISGDRVRLSSRTCVELLAWTGSVNLWSSSLQSGNGWITVHAAAPSQITGSRLLGNSVDVEGTGSLAFTNDVVGAQPDGGVFLIVDAADAGAAAGAAGSVLDITGSRLMVKPYALTLDAGTIVK